MGDIDDTYNKQVRIINDFIDRGGNFTVRQVRASYLEVGLSFDERTLFYVQSLKDSGILRQVQDTFYIEKIWEVPEKDGEDLHALFS